MGQSSRAQGRSVVRSSSIAQSAFGLSAAGLGAILCLLSSCDQSAASQTTEALPAAELHDVSDQEPAATAMRMTVEDAASLGVATSRLEDVIPKADAASAPTSAPAADAAFAPIELRAAKQRLTVRLAPDHRAPIRARIPRGESFEVFERVEGRGCGGDGWAHVGNGGFVCLKHSKKTTKAPRMMPATRGGEVLPYFFAQNRKDVPARRWRSLQSYLRGDEPQMVYSPGRDYAFVSLLREGGKNVFIDKRGRVMLERELDRYRPTSFQGRDFVAAPVPEGQQLAWAVDWPLTTVRVAAEPEAEAVRTLEYHGEYFIEPEPVRSSTGGLWFELVDGGFVRARDIRRLEATVAPLVGEEVAEDEIWLDVELDQQVLTVMRGSTPIYATLISSGLKGPTPHGLFRVAQKHAFGSMNSRPGAAEAYAVEAVPYVQYIDGNIALHGAYWHDRFGFRISHGCVNLSPRDARHVYSLTGPHARGGWEDVYEDEGDLGTRVRIHEGENVVVVDRRGPVERVTG
jgi:lipoprotein-anchoring transpeptidase ErfK/SrfK